MVRQALGRRILSLSVRPKRGGFLRPFGCGWFIREFLLGHGPNGSPVMNPDIGACQADIFHYYKMALIRATAMDRAVRHEEKEAKRRKRSINPDNISILFEKHMANMPYKVNGCRYHSFVTYFSMLQRLGWVEPSGREEPSSFQEHYSSGQPRRYYRLTEAGCEASDSAWSNPHATLYGRDL